MLCYSARQHRASILSPSQWNHTTLDIHLLSGDEIYTRIRLLTDGQVNAHPIPESGYLMIRNFDVIKQHFSMYNNTFYIEYDQDPSLFGSLMDNKNEAGIGLTLHDALTRLFDGHAAGILISAGKSYAVMHYEERYYFADSHSCGPKGAPAP